MQPVWLIGKLYRTEVPKCNRKLYSPVLSCTHHGKIPAAKPGFVCFADKIGFVFAFLVFIDCFTKWVSISYLHLKDSGIENPTILESIKGITKARAAKKIKSEVMKHRFLGKIGVYLICALSSAVVDVVMRVLDKPTWAVMTVIGYLVVTELLSIIENLNDAGVEAMSGLIVFVKKKL